MSIQKDDFLQGQGNPSMPLSIANTDFYLFDIVCMSSCKRLCFLRTFEYCCTINNFTDNILGSA